MLLLVLLLPIYSISSLVALRVPFIIRASRFTRSTKVPAKHRNNHNDCADGYYQAQALHMSSTPLFPLLLKIFVSVSPVSLHSSHAVSRPPLLFNAYLVFLSDSCVLGVLSLSLSPLGSLDVLLSILLSKSSSMTLSRSSSFLIDSASIPTLAAATSKRCQNCESSGAICSGNTLSLLPSPPVFSGV